jgi:hypothetical protein
MAEDNWKHLDTTMTCEFCMYWVLKDNKLGRCRKHAPTLDGWPATYMSDWCGDHKLHNDPMGGQKPVQMSNVGQMLTEGKTLLGTPELVELANELSYKGNEYKLGDRYNG